MMEKKRLNETQILTNILPEINEMSSYNKRMQQKISPSSRSQSARVQESGFSSMFHPAYLLKGEHVIKIFPESEVGREEDGKEGQQQTEEDDEQEQIVEVRV